MKKQLVLISLFLSAIVFLLFVTRQLSFPDSNKGDLTVIVTNFGSKNNSGQWQGEVAPFLNRLENTGGVGSELIMCDEGFKGTLYGKPVLVIVTGMAKVKTSACVTDVLAKYGKSVKEVILVGIAGFSPMKGGLTDKLGKLRTGEKVMIGDVCINSVAYDFDLQHYSSDQANSSLPEPLFWSQKSDFSSIFTFGNSELADELYQASLQVEWPEANASINEINFSYHKASRKPRPWSPNECLEVTDDLFWHDTRADQRARELGADYLAEAYGSTFDAEDILVATSMEAVAAGKVVDWWNEANEDDIAFAYVRGASNFDHSSLNTNGTPSIDGKASLEKLMDAGGRKFAIETESLPIFKMLELRSGQTGDLR